MSRPSPAAQAIAPLRAAGSDSGESDAEEEVSVPRPRRGALTSNQVPFGSPQRIALAPVTAPAPSAPHPPQPSWLAAAEEREGPSSPKYRDKAAAVGFGTVSDESRLLASLTQPRSVHAAASAQPQLARASAPAPEVVRLAAGRQPAFSAKDPAVDAADSSLDYRANQPGNDLSHAASPALMVPDGHGYGAAEAAYDQDGAYTGGWDTDGGHTDGSMYGDYEEEPECEDEDEAEAAAAEAEFSAAIAASTAAAAAALSAAISRPAGLVALSRPDDTERAAEAARAASAAGTAVPLAVVRAAASTGEAHHPAVAAAIAAASASAEHASAKKLIGQSAVAAADSAVAYAIEAAAAGVTLLPGELLKRQVAARAAGQASAAALVAATAAPPLLGAEPRTGGSRAPSPLRAASPLRAPSQPARPMERSAASLALLMRARGVQPSEELLSAARPQERITYGLAPPQGLPGAAAAALPPGVIAMAPVYVPTSPLAWLATAAPAQLAQRLRPSDAAATRAAKPAEAPMGLPAPGVVGALPPGTPALPANRAAAVALPEQDRQEEFGGVESDHHAALERASAGEEDEADQALTRGEAQWAEQNEGEELDQGTLDRVGDEGVEEVEGDDAEGEEDEVEEEVDEEEEEEEGEAATTSYLQSFWGR